MDMIFYEVFILGGSQLFQKQPSIHLEKRQIFYKSDQLTFANIQWRPIQAALLAFYEAN